MAIDFRNVINWTIPQGDCIRVYDSSGAIIWQKETYTDLDYVTCKDAFTGIIIPVNIPVGSTYEIMVDSRVTAKSYSSGRGESIVMGGINENNNHQYGWGFPWDMTYYITSSQYYTYNTEQVYFNGWTTDYTSNRWSTNGVIIDNETKMTLRNLTRTFQNIATGTTTNHTLTRTADLQTEWNKSTAVNGWWGFGVMASGENSWYTDSKSRFIGNIYSAYIKIDDVYIYNFKPVVRDRDGVYGLYDTISNTFYPSSTSNPFTHEVIPITSLTVNNTYVGLGKTKGIGRTITPTNATNKSLTWYSSNPSIMTVNSSGAATGISLGSCTATATTKDGSNLTSSGTITVYKPTEHVYLDKYSAVVGVGDSVTISATVDPSDAEFTTVRWTGGNSSYMRVTDNSNNTVTVTGLAVTGNASYAITGTCDGVSSTCYVKVIDAVTHVEDVSLNTNAITLERGNTRKLTVTVTPSDASNTSVTWYSSDETVATVDGSGNVTAVGDGTCYITARADDNGISDSCTVTVPTHRLTIDALPSSASVSFTDYNTNYNYVDVPRGITVEYLVTAPGYVSVMGSYTMGSSDHTIEVILQSATVTVNSVTLNTHSATIEDMATLQLSATVSPSNASDPTVTWTTSNSSVATVSSNGLVTGKGPGTCTITCTSNSNSSISDSCSITVYNFDISDSDVQLTAIGQSQTIFGVLSPNSVSVNGKWVSSNTSVATVSDTTTHTLSGREYVTITAVGRGVATIAFESPSLTTMINTFVCLVRVTAAPTAKSITLYNPTSSTIHYGNDSTTNNTLGTTSVALSIEEGSSLYISRNGEGTSDIVIDSCDRGSIYSIHASTYEFEYDNIVDGDLITLGESLS